MAKFMLKKIEVDAHGDWSVGTFKHRCTRATMLAFIEEQSGNSAAFQTTRNADLAEEVVRLLQLHRQNDEPGPTTSADAQKTSVSPLNAATGLETGNRQETSDGGHINPQDMSSTKDDNGDTVQGGLSEEDEGGDIIGETTPDTVRAILLAVKDAALRDSSNLFGSSVAKPIHHLKDDEDEHPEIQRRYHTLKRTVDEYGEMRVVLDNNNEPVISERAQIIIRHILLVIYENKRTSGEYVKAWTVEEERLELSYERLCSELVAELENEGWEVSVGAIWGIVREIFDF